ncbi:MAG TPA: type II toxin-antitoxin system VapC family toxin [Rhizomicrobium sp.]|nr:type II toxin-antitoxin system VapC family toxin [Rhizomicrobium sp.]
MIAVDTSALMAIVLNEPKAAPCARALQNDPELLISAVTVAEALIVARARNVADEMGRLIDGMGFQFVNVNASTPERIARIYSKWGRGYHSANLNFGDCFAYDVARENDCRLLFVGDDFARTDIGAVL